MRLACSLMALCACTDGVDGPRGASVTADGSDLVRYEAEATCAAAERDGVDLRDPGAVYTAEECDGASCLAVPTQQGQVRRVGSVLYVTCEFGGSDTVRVRWVGL